eukprot:Trichotokara_eunicae@DN4691_c0_g1_i2.p2
MGKKSKKAGGADSFGAQLKLVMKSGKAVLGYRTTMNAIRQNKAKLVIVAKNTPPLRRSEIEYYGLVAKIAIHHYAGDNNELGVACGKLFRVGVLAVTEFGDADMLSTNTA